MYLPDTARLTVVSCTRRVRRLLPSSSASNAMGRARGNRAAGNDLLRDVHNCLLPLMDRADQEFAAADFVPDVIFDVAALRVARRNDVLIQVADPQMGNLFVVEGRSDIRRPPFPRSRPATRNSAARQRKPGRGEDSIARCYRRPFARPRR
jgi:hypothetical protein